MVIMMLRHAPLILAFALGFQDVASAEPRAALIVGNAAYGDGKTLRHSVNDARDMAAMLRRLGFAVLLQENADKPTMDAGLRRFGDYLSRNHGVGVFYFSGHGAQVDGDNFLAP